MIDMKQFIKLLSILFFTSNAYGQIDDIENTFVMLQTDAFKDTKGQKVYFDEIPRNKKKLVGHGGFLLGTWIPQGNLEIVGVHPFFGFRGGINYKRLMADATIGFKFGKSPNAYQVYKNGSIWDTEHFFGGYIGLDVGFEIFRIKNRSFSFIGGAAFDGFDALRVDDPNSDTDIIKTLNTLNLNIGVGYKYHIDQWNYIGLDFKYNMVNYKNDMGTDLSGNALTINLLYGFYSK